MRKFISNSPLAILSVILLVSLVSFFIVNACRKLDHQAQRKIDKAERFLTLPANTHPAIKKVVDKIRRVNQRSDFLNDFISRQGFAVWNKSIITPIRGGNGISAASKINGEDGYCLLIPLVLEDADQVHGAIACRVTEDSVFFTLLDGSQYSSYNSDSASKGLNGRQLSLTLMYLDSIVFGHHLFHITDSAAFAGKGKVKYVRPDSVILAPSTDRAAIYTMSICYPVWIQPDNGQLVGCVPGEPNCNGWTVDTYCEYYTFMDDDGYGIDNDNPPPPSDGGGGGGGGNGMCRFFPTIGHQCGTGGSPGWVPVVDQVYDPYESVPVELDTSITNNFPCVQKIMDSMALLFNVHVASQVSLNEVFGIEKRMHFTYKLNRNWTKDSLDGHTNVDPAYTHEDSDDFFATIELNPWVLANSTHEYIAATIIHEAVHAYINFKYWQYTAGLIDSTEFKTLFPLYWPPRTIGYANQTVLYNIGNTAQHQAMAANLVDIMSAPLELVNSNPAISHAVRDSINKALTWAGLQETTVWHTKSDTCNIKAINTFARDTLVIAPFVQTGGGCSLTINDDAHTLHMKRGCQ